LFNRQKDDVERISELIFGASWLVAGHISVPGGHRQQCDRQAPQAVSKARSINGGEFFNGRSVTLFAWSTDRAPSTLFNGTDHSALNAIGPPSP
jgi:hypothetical protein